MKTAYPNTALSSKKFPDSGFALFSTVTSFFIAAKASAEIDAVDVHLPRDEIFIC